MEKKVREGRIVENTILPLTGEMGSRELPPKKRMEELIIAES